MDSHVTYQTSLPELSLSCKRFSFEEIERATSKFSDQNLKYRDNNWNYYRGNISGNTYSEEVFIKRLRHVFRNASSLMFENEIKVLTARRHVNIISLVGFCDEKDESILVYEFMPNGSLFDHLYKHKDTHPPLSMEQRLNICLGVAKGLCHLHSGTDFNVIHDLLSTANIILDASFVPKISGFTYARISYCSKELIRQGHDTMYYSYSPPECHGPGYKVSIKSDVYTFGVVFLEVLCERSPLNRLLALALPSIMKGELSKCTPEHVKKNITPACAQQCEKLIMNCLKFQPDKRPCMNQVVQDLELALKLQKGQRINFKEQDSHGTCQTSLSELSLSCKRFSFEEIGKATSNFSNQNLKYRDNNWNYYGGNISGNSYSGEVFIKRLRYGFRNASSLMFENEIKVLTARRHVNIISLVGFCDEKDEKILVYEFMPNGSLFDHLYKHEDTLPPLSMEQRLNICLGVAKGLCHLHSGTDFNVIHDLLCTANIILDASFVPKISGFTYARISYCSKELIRQGQDTVYYSYSPPECHGSGYKVSIKSDVYTFAVVLLEVLCERSPLNRLLVLALPSIMKGELPKCTPEHVKKNITPACARQCEKLIMKCLEFQPDKRPCMDQVVQDLELALKLQKDKDINFKEQSSGVNNVCQSFSLVEIEKATNGFTNTLGKGSFGKVYRGKISDNGKDIDVAVKLMSIDPEQGIPAFEIEKKILSACRHANVISLLGYCDERDKKLLVYEFMANGSLYDYLYTPKDATPRLTVEQRLEICLGVAKGLSYLHSRDDYNIIHSDLKTDNILLDANLVPKISDFGLSRTRAIGPFTSLQVTKHIQGTDGYIAPECYERGYKLSRKADVYAFGVILLEVLCEKPGWERLVIWALPFMSKGELPKFTPEHVVKNISLECSRACANLIRDCLDISPNNRPSMSHVVVNLDLALILQKMNENGDGEKKKSQANHQKMFSLSDIETATNNFAIQNLLPEYTSSTQKVYSGKISVDVVVKRMTWTEGSFPYDIVTKDEDAFLSSCRETSSIMQSHTSLIKNETDLIQNEIDSLLACHHANIISLVGYWDGKDEKILIYEFMPNGSLYDHVHTKQDGTILLTVEQRLEICLGVAKGLSYLHSSNIIHGSLNSKRILLDRNFVAKITGLEFSIKCGVGQLKYENPGMQRRYLTRDNYVDRYTSSQKGDVYAFGVTFLEVLCERQVDGNLVMLALPFIVKGELAKFTPEHVGTYISRKCAHACENLLRDCLDDSPDKRPFMNQVVEKLELALKLQIQDVDY